ncbi:response regulator transcription factor [Motiliproteus sp. SC1-56]|uniref:response regulator n=1 Tax=Motiliproteus sp. SC1-56 TaxID=2799565 RepID=UPI001A8CEC01|nr:response regulator transcription factor [Motiliproteus sp. SC1-56]
MTRIRVVLADDHPLFRDGVARTIADHEAFEVVGQGGSAEEAVNLVQDLLPDLALLDVSMPGSGIEAARVISRTCPVVKIVMLTVSEQDDDVMAALKAGARGYVLKGIGGEDLTEVLQAVYRGDSYVSPSLAARLLAEMQAPADKLTKTSQPLELLTAREEQILRLVAQGQSNKEVGRNLNLQEKTIKHYMTNILQKLQVRNRVEAALLAREHFSDKLVS